MTCYEDTGRNAWKAFNRIFRERIFKGGVIIRSITNRHLDAKNWNGIRRKAKGITALSENIRINQSLWDMTMNWWLDLLQGVAIFATFLFNVIDFNLN